MIIEETKLECSDADALVLDYWLGGEGETKEQWAKRIWFGCLEYQETNGKGHDGNGMEEVYKRSAFDVWEEKKISRRIRLLAHISGKHPNITEETYLKNAEENLKNGVILEWSSSHCDESVLQELENPLYNTADEEHQKKLDARAVLVADASKKVVEDITSLRLKGFDDETIAIIYPQSIGIIEEMEVPIV